MPFEIGAKENGLYVGAGGKIGVGVNVVEPLLGGCKPAASKCVCSGYPLFGAFKVSLFALFEYIFEDSVEPCIVLELVR